MESFLRGALQLISVCLQGWVELHLLQRSGDSVLKDGATEQSYSRLREEGQELLRLTQVTATPEEEEEEQEQTQVLM